MSLIAKGGKSFTPPPEGLWSAVCVDVIDLGQVETQWGNKAKCRIVWEISETMNDGKRFIASKQYTLSLHEKSSLHKDLKAWRGKAFTAEELEGFDLEKILGAPCQLVITHEEKEGSIYGNVTAIMKADKSKGVLKPSGGYIRMIDRSPKPAQNPGDGDGTEEDPNIVPF